VIQAVGGDLIIVRFSPLRTDALMEQAETSALDCEAEGLPRVYSISTFGRVLNEGDTLSDVMHTICSEAPAGGKRIWVTTARALREAGFNVSLSEPPPHHYDVELGTDLCRSDVDKLVALFEPGREVNPAWKSSRSQ